MTGEEEGADWVLQGGDEGGFVSGRSVFGVPLLALVLLVSFHLVFVGVVVLWVARWRFDVGPGADPVLLGAAYLFVLLSGTVTCNITVAGYSGRKHLRIWLGFLLVHALMLILCGGIVLVCSMERAPPIITVAPEGLDAYP